MEKISITVKIATLGRSFDFFVPNNMSIRDSIDLIIKILNSEYGLLNQNGNVMLFDKNEKESLPMECSFSQLGISDGTELLLI